MSLRNFWFFLKELVKIKLCFHYLCHPCLKKIVAANACIRELPNLDVTPTESLKCPKSDCYTKLPIICAEAMNLALEGNVIAVRMRKRAFIAKIISLLQIFLCDWLGQSQLCPCEASSKLHYLHKHYASHYFVNYTCSVLRNIILMHLS